MNQLGGSRGGLGSQTRPAAAGAVMPVPVEQRSVQDLRNDLGVSIGNILEILHNDIVGAQQQFEQLRVKLAPVLGPVRMGHAENQSAAKVPDQSVSQHKTNALACLDQIRELREHIDEMTSCVEV